LAKEEKKHFGLKKQYPLNTLKMQEQGLQKNAKSQNINSTLSRKRKMMQGFQMQEKRRHFIGLNTQLCLKRGKMCHATITYPFITKFKPSLLFLHDILRQVANHVITRLFFFLLK
jgi:hypothetical protein